MAIQTVKIISDVKTISEKNGWASIKDPEFKIKFKIIKKLRIKVKILNVLCCALFMFYTTVRQYQH